MECMGSEKMFEGGHVDTLLPFDNRGYCKPLKKKHVATSQNPGTLSIES